MKEFLNYKEIGTILLNNWQNKMCTFKYVILTNKNPKEKYEKNYQYTNK